MSGTMAATKTAACPFLVPVMADRIWLSPTSAYCRRPEGRVRVPARCTVDCICLTAAHLVCDGYVQHRASERGGVP